MNDQEVKLIQALKQGFKLEKQPFRRIAQELGLQEEEVIRQIEDLQKRGLIRRVGVAVRPIQAGFTTNALVAWEVPPERVDEVGSQLAGIPEISHCYDRAGPPGWKFNLFTMIHATSEDHLGDLLENLKKRCGLTAFQVYRTTKEYKKSSPDFFPSGGGRE
jgi:DNA-binding Lrp family transcriptional regulator